MAKACLTARRTCQAETKVGHSDPVVLRGRAIDQRIKGTPGITGLSPLRDHIDGEVWHLDVDSSHPGVWIIFQGFGCSPIKVVRELGSERCETVRFLSTVVLWKIERCYPVYERIRVDMPMVFELWCQPQCSVATHGMNNCWKHISRKSSLRQIFLMRIVLDKHVDRIGV